MANARITPEMRLEIIDWHRQGVTVRAIAEHIGVHHSAVQRLLKRDADKLTPTDQVAELMSQGMTFRQIATELNMTLDAVKSAFKRIKRALGPQAR